MKITPIKIANIIRQEQQKLFEAGKNSQDYCFNWGTEGFDALSKVLQANAPCNHGWFCLCGSGSEEYMEKHFKQGLTFMGVKHYWDKRLKGYSVNKSNNFIIKH